MHVKTIGTLTLCASLALAACLDASKFDDAPDGGLDVGVRSVPDRGLMRDSATLADAEQSDAEQSDAEQLDAAQSDAAATLDATQSDAGTVVDGGADAAMMVDGSATADAIPPADAAPLPGPCRVHFVVDVSDDTPDGAAIYVAGDFSAPEWEPALPALAIAREGNVAEATIEIDQGRMEYKYTRGAWETVERRADCGDVDNRVQFVQCQGDAEFEIRDTVARWADQCD